jgi:S-formylglutathione hydrolase
VSAISLVSEHACYGGVQRFYRHESRETRGPMKFSAYLPPQARSGKVPVLYFLSGLTCTEETFCIKSHAQQSAAELGLMLISPDTSPREPRIPGDADHWDFGYSAGFYLDATQAPWSQNYRMYSYVTRELPEIVAADLPARQSATGIFGHSMGGHGALTLALRNPSLYKAYPGPILIDQGSADQYLAAELLPEKFAAAAAKSGQQLNLRMQPGYDHGYYFIQTFMADHLRHHAEQLRDL